MSAAPGTGTAIRPSLASIDRHAVIVDERVRVVDQRMFRLPPEPQRAAGADGRDLIRWGRAAGLSN